MIKETEIAELLGNKFPAINTALEKLPDTSDAYKTLQCFADFTKQLAGKGKLKEVKHCFEMAERMLLQGNNSVKRAIENSYLFSVAVFIDIAGPLRDALKSMLTPSLKLEYKRQTGACGM